MKKIGLISDTHNFLDDKIFEHFQYCDEIWHAGDFGSMEIAERIQKHKPLKAVYGNVDGSDIRSVYPATLKWRCEEVSIVMTHIGGYPPKYHPSIINELKRDPPQLFISGHSHILKIMFDKQLNCLHINPGAAGKQGWHIMRTIVRFGIDGTQIKDCEVIELGKRNAVI